MAFKTNYLLTKLLPPKYMPGMVDKWVELWERDFFDMACEKRQTWKRIQGFITKEEAKGMSMP